MVRKLNRRDRLSHKVSVFYVVASGGLNEVTVGELRKATSTLPEGDVARERAAGQGARLVRGEDHKHFDAGVRTSREYYELS